MAGNTTDNYVYDGMNPVQIRPSVNGSIEILSRLWLDDWLTSIGSSCAVNSTGLCFTRAGFTRTVAESQLRRGEVGIPPLPMEFRQMLLR